MYWIIAIEHSNFHSMVMVLGADLALYLYCLTDTGFGWIGAVICLTADRFGLSGKVGMS
jgi:hypothetical protein